MIGPAVTEQLIAHGHEPNDAAARVALLAQAQAMLLAHTGQPPAWAWVIPGRIEIFGKHTDYAGGRSLVAAVPKGFVGVAAPRDGEARLAPPASGADYVGYDVHRAARIAAAARSIHESRSAAQPRASSFVSFFGSAVSAATTRASRQPVSHN